MKGDKMLLSVPNPYVLDKVISADAFPITGRCMLYNTNEIPVMIFDDIIMKRNDSKIYFTNISINPQLVDLNKFVTNCGIGDVFRAHATFFNNYYCGGLHYFYKIGEYTPDENGGHGFLVPATTEDSDAIKEFCRGEIISMPVDD